MKKLFEELLRQYCDALLSVQFMETGDKTLDGGFYCRSCKLLHGRAHDAVYPLVVMAKHSGQRKYLDAADAVFNFGDNFLCDDGSFLNDAQSVWKNTTVFYAINLCEALNTGKQLLSPTMLGKWESRLAMVGKWLYDNLDEHTSDAVINYPTTNSAALAMIGKYFGNEAYLVRAAHLADYAMSMISENGFLCGEGHPKDGVSPLGCRYIDIGYNMEESIPALVKYAFAVDDGDMKARLADILLKQLDFMLPDGAWDNSFGCRNNKWTYWGSRTSDGCAPAYILLADYHPAFAEAARRNTELLRACTHDGFLYGGPHYHAHGEYPCTHHTFDHAGSIAFALEHCGNLTAEAKPLPIDTAVPLSYYPEINTYKLAMGNYRATVTGYDMSPKKGQHASGGTLSLLWKYGVGPMIAASVTDYVIVESHNQQLTKNTLSHRSLVPRLVLTEQNVTYSTSYFSNPIMNATKTDDDVSIEVKTGFADQNKKTHSKTCHVLYTLTECGLSLNISDAENTSFILPLIAGELCLLTGNISKKEQTFFLTGGFMATEYTITPNTSGEIKLFLK